MAQPLWLRIVGARQNNLKNMTLALPQLIPRLLQRGFIRAKLGQKIVELDHGLELPSGEKELLVVLDRITITADRRAGLTESLEAAFREGGGHAPS